MEKRIKVKQNKNILDLIKIVLQVILIISIICELIFFPSKANFCGCIMTIICYFIFSRVFLNRKRIMEYPFSFMMFLSMFMYRYLPLLGTLLGGKPISYGMERPIKTFTLETLLFSISSLAYYCSYKKIKKNNVLQILLKNIGFYKDANKKVFWIMGIIGVIAKIIAFAGKNINFGALKTILTLLQSFIYAPIIIFFPCFYNKTKIEEKRVNFKNVFVWIYLIFITILNFAANSRNKIIAPFGIIVLLYFLYLCINNISIKKILNPQKSIPIIVIFIIIIKLLSMISDAILITRDIRGNVSFTQLIKETASEIINSDKIEDDKENEIFKTHNYNEGWTEEYIDNFMLNRYANIRITDETLYLSEKVGNLGKKNMQEDLKNRIIALLPEPIINFLGLKNFDKTMYYNSRGDMLYMYSGIGNKYSIGGYRVTSHLGDGLSTFGILYFPIQFIMFFLVFKLLNCYVYYDKEKGLVYSVFGLISIYDCLGMFRNANGIMGEINICLRTYWEDIFIFIIIFTIARKISIIKIKK